ncbi:MAG: hypothetical protein ACOZNI_20975 [Myxococcota bacterium]
MIRAIGRWGLCLVTLAIFVAPERAWAIPAFARRYETSCQTCHLAYPKLTPFGEAFRRNAYHFPEDGDAVSEKEEPVPLGNDAQAERWPAAVWPGQIPGRLPLSVTIAGKVQYGSAFEAMSHGDEEVSSTESSGGAHEDMEDVAEAELDLSQAVESLGLRAGGVLGDHVSFFAAVNVGGHEAIEAERANVVFTPLARPSTLLVRVGRFEPDVHGVTIHRGLTGHLLRLTTQPVGDATFAVEPYRNGLELSGVAARRIGWTAGVVENTTPATFLAKDAWGRAEVKIGGMPLDGSGGVAGTAAWREVSLTVGASAWSGREVVQFADDEILRLGVDAHAALGDLLVDVVVARESHTAADDGLPVDADQLYAEVSWVATPVVFPTARLEVRRIDEGGADWLGLAVANAVVRPNVLVRAMAGLGAEPGEAAGFRFAAIEYAVAF